MPEEVNIMMEMFFISRSGVRNIVISTTRSCALALLLFFFSLLPHQHTLVFLIMMRTAA